ncbi:MULTISPECIES: hypothetical protein [unclassified Arthrobacter]
MERRTQKWVHRTLRVGMVAALALGFTAASPEMGRPVPGAFLA